MGQDYSTYKSVFDVLTSPTVYSIEKELARHSPVLSSLYKSVDSSKGKPVTGLETFTGRDIKIAINSLYPVYYSNLAQFNIQHGDVKVPAKGKNVQYATINAVDKGFTVGAYTSDIQLLKSQGADQNKNKYVNYINDLLENTLKGFSISLCNSIYNGLGDSATDDKGNIKPDFYGLLGTNGIIGTGTYGGKSSADFSEWKARNWDLAGATSALRLGYTATDVDTIAELVAVPSGRKTSRFYDIINRARLQLEEISGEEVLCIMPPSIYDFIWIPCLEANTISAPSRFAKSSSDALEVGDTISMMGPNFKIVRENTRVPSSEIGGTPQYILGSDTILFINSKYLHLQVESNNNFIMGEWDYVQSQYGTLQKSMETTLLFFATKRYNMGTLKMASAVKTELDAMYMY
ncbi:MAG: hypothetical protein HGB12_00200 [Bacteroidetes bacterium]|nr:hypothetical protein [Bacteroidota bacterium]